MDIRSRLKCALLRQNCVTIVRICIVELDIFPRRPRAFEQHLLMSMNLTHFRYIILSLITDLPYHFRHLRSTENDHFFLAFYYCSVSQFSSLLGFSNVHRTLKILGHSVSARIMLHSTRYIECFCLQFHGRTGKEYVPNCNEVTSESPWSKHAMQFWGHIILGIPRK